MFGLKSADADLFYYNLNLNVDTVKGWKQIRVKHIRISADADLFLNLNVDTEGG